MDYIIKRDAWHDRIESFGKPRTKTLPSNFRGQEAKEGYNYYRWYSSNNYHLYEVTNTTTQKVHYEIFQRFVEEITKRDIRELYPWDEPVMDTIVVYTNNNAVLHRWGELMRESN